MSIHDDYCKPAPSHSAKGQVASPALSAANACSCLRRGLARVVSTGYARARPGINERRPRIPDAPRAALLLAALCYTGCTPSIRPKLQPDSVTYRTGAKHSVQLKVYDDQPRIKLTGDGGWGWTPGLSKPVDELVRDAFAQGLKEAGFEVNDDSPITLDIYIHVFDAAWPGGLNVPVNARVRVVVEVKLVGLELTTEILQSEFTDRAAGGGFPAAPVAERVLSRCLTEVVCEFFSTRRLVAAIEGKLLPRPPLERTVAPP